MTTLSPPPTPSPPVGRSARPATRQEQLIAAAERFGHLELGDKRWESEQVALDQLLVEAVQLSTGPRRAVWDSIVADPTTPLVVKLRTLGAVLQSFRM